ncbi:conserved hypothetical protein [Talaromyces stipitatus ATCC 10500]|uniref:Zn(2)-C6 fungal-type domain-containing protein n=1 Tax=Talaromyces stipitatus (strain ATCC 10500 / CBS 375.48 / QM 6759 / NRRL 1006) TaxID=441959 RepID=B8MK21_TALSN|nr:uncharacterized protein TSTA_043130 [Talaromyces stipitatus ATCC 10500]EED14838.1 conserved hypothetical protein [Talaromyces stipitatus ATCC 10500]
MPLRSHHGCARCKQRRQKCDEKRPSCTRCTEAAVTCEYVITLKWDGRVPRKQEQASSRQRRARKSASTTWRICSGEGRSPPNARLLMNTSEKGLDLIKKVDAFNGLCFRDKLLLNHFITTVSMLMSHTSLRDQACQILPVALETPSLLYATLAFSALHLSTLVNDDYSGNGSLMCGTPAEDILASSITHLRQELNDKNTTTNTTGLLHTVKTLCLFEIYSGKYDSSWRAHLKGARALLQTRGLVPTNQLGGWLISRWYISIEALSAVTKDENRDEEQKKKFIYPIIDAVATHGSVLDIYAGYSSDLHLAFRDIGHLMQQYASVRTPKYYCGDDILTEFLIHCDECIEIEYRVEKMIRRDRNGKLQIPPEISLSPDELRMFAACNTAYQYSALLHIRRRLHNMDSDSEQVQQCVRGVLDTVCEVRPVSVLSPWILLTTPIFTAGCDAIDQDRDTVKTLLQELYTVLRIRNVLRAIKILEEHWKWPYDCTDIANFLPF